MEMYSGSCALIGMVRVVGIDNCHENPYSENEVISGWMNSNQPTNTQDECSNIPQITNTPQWTTSLSNNAYNSHYCMDTTRYNAFPQNNPIITLLKQTQHTELCTNALQVNRLHVVLITIKMKHITTALRLIALLHLVVNPNTSNHHRSEVRAHSGTESTQATNVRIHEREVQVLYSSQHQHTQTGFQMNGKILWNERNDDTVTVDENSVLRLNIAVLLIKSHGFISQNGCRLIYIAVKYDRLVFRLPFKKRVSATLTNTKSLFTRDT